MTADELQALRREHRSLTLAARAIGVSPSTLFRKWREFVALGVLEPIGKDGLTPSEREARVETGVEFGTDDDGEILTVTARGNVREVAVGDVAALLAERGLSIDEWDIVNLVVNEWDGPVAGGGTQKLRQLKAHLRPKRIIDALLRPAALPPIKLPSAKPFRAMPGDLGVLTGCWQYPYHDETFEGLFERWLADVKPEFGVDLGDGMDAPSISRHRDDPAHNASAQECVDAYGLALYRRRHVSPETRWTILLGNHDIRFLTEQLQRAERLAGLRPAAFPTDEATPEPLMSPRRMLRLDELGIEAVLPPGGNYALAELRISDRFIAVHGVKTDANGAARATVRQYGCSVAMAHSHRQRLFSVSIPQGPRPAVDATGVEVGCGAKIDGGLGYAVRPDWTNGAMTVVLDDEGEPFFEPMRYRDGVLRWRGMEWRA